jgi:hypothetical protein
MNKEPSNDNKRYTKFTLNGYKWRIAYTKKDDITSSAHFDAINKVITLNENYIKDYATYVESLRHELFEACLTINGCRYISLDMNDNVQIIMQHKQLDIVLGAYHHALETLE